MNCPPKSACFARSAPRPVPGCLVTAAYGPSFQKALCSSDLHERPSRDHSWTCLMLQYHPQGTPKAKSSPLLYSHDEDAEPGSTSRANVQPSSHTCPVAPPARSCSNSAERRLRCGAAGSVRADRPGQHQSVALCAMTAASCTHKCCLDACSAPVDVRKRSVTEGPHTCCHLYCLNRAQTP